MSKASGGVWPGYVAAIACLLQALVVVCGVIALIIATVSVLGTTKSGSNELGDMNLYLQELAHHDFLRIKYIGDTLYLPDDSVKALTDALKPVPGNAKQKIKVWINVPSSSTLTEREAYLRLISIKTLASKIYGANNSIEFQIFSVPSTSFPDDILHFTRLE